MMRLEGSGASQFVQLIKTIGHNQDINIELATVTSAPPNLKIKVDNMSIELEKEDLIVAESLTAHSRAVTFKVNNNQENKLLEPDLEGTLSFSSALKTGDRVIVAEINNGQTYVVIDKAVIY